MPNTPGEALGLRLLSDGAVAGLVGDRVTPTKPTQEPAADYLVYTKTGGGDGINAGGRKKLQEYLFRVDIYAATDTAAQAILTAVIVCLTGWVDRSSGVQGCFPVGDEDDNTLDDARQVTGKTFRLFYMG
jgi:hypothetical protein